MTVFSTAVDGSLMAKSAFFFTSKYSGAALKRKINEVKEKERQKEKARRMKQERETEIVVVVFRLAVFLPLSPLL